MSGFRSLATRLVITMLVPLSLLLLLATWVETQRASRAMIATGETAAANLGSTVKEELQGVLRSTKIGVEALALGLQQVPSLSAEQAEMLLVETVGRFPLLYGSALAFEAGETGGEPLAPYVYRSGDTLVTTSLATNNYRYWDQEWFTRPLAEGAAVWTDPYQDDGGGDIRMVTYAVPLEIDGRRAVLTADLALEFLSEIAESSLLGRPGAVLVFDREGRLVAHPRDEWLLNKRLADLASGQQLPALDAVGSAVAAREELWLRPADGMHAGLLGGDPLRPGRLFVLPLKEAGWGIGVYFSDDVFLADIKSATRFRLMFSLGLLILLASTLALVSLRSLRPLGELATRTRAIARGEFHGETPGQERRDEIGQLSRAFHRMQDQLKIYIQDLTQATAAQERIDAELTTARLLQHALLPKERPDPAETGADVACMLHSAREVGGDLFNYSRSDEQHLFFVIGDVSDKGVPAALFMTRTNALLKAAAVRGGGPQAVVSAVNQALSEENELCMFVTLLAGELNLETGALRLASAGHDAPFRLSSDGEVAELPLETGPPLGIDQDAQFPVFTSTLGPGDSLVTFTDGVTEARSPAGELFGTHRLVNALQSANRENAGTLLNAVNGAVEAFAAGAEQADDLTLLVIRRLDGAVEATAKRRHTPVSETMEFKPDTSCFIEVNKRMGRALQESGCKACDPADLRLITEELLTNMAHHSDALKTGKNAQVSWVMTRDRLDLAFRDPGIPFNPLEDATPRDGDDRSEGGMGVMLVCALADSIRYSRVDDTNLLELRFVSSRTRTQP